MDWMMWIFWIFMSISLWVGMVMVMWFISHNLTKMAVIIFKTAKMNVEYYIAEYKEKRNETV